MAISAKKTASEIVEVTPSNATSIGLVEKGIYDFTVASVFKIHYNEDKTVKGHSVFLQIRDDNKIYQIIMFLRKNQEEMKDLMKKVIEIEYVGLITQNNTQYLNFKESIIVV
jgi:hypothetical protein